VADALMLHVNYWSGFDQVVSRLCVREIRKGGATIYCSLPLCSVGYTVGMNYKQIHAPWYVHGLLKH